MKLSTVIACTVALAASAGILGGCSMGSQVPPQSGASFVPTRYSLTHSWIDPAWQNELRDPHHKKRKLLYLGDAQYGSVDIIDYKTGSAIGRVAGFEYPYGLCSDKNGNVYVADFDREKGFEIQAGTTTVINSWSTGGEAFGCSVSDGGDVAFTNFAPGSVIVFPGGGPTGHSYPGPGDDFPAGYDDKGNLFAMCADVAPCSTPQLAELPAGGDQWVLLSFSGSPAFPSGVEWDGKYLSLAGTCTGSAACIDQVAVSGSTATIVNTVELNGSGCSGEVSSFQWAQDATKPNGELKSHTTAVAEQTLCLPSEIVVWRYPAGGDPKRTISSSYSYASGSGATLIKI